MTSLRITLFVITLVASITHIRAQSPMLVDTSESGAFHANADFAFFKAESSGGVSLGYIDDKVRVYGMYKRHWGEVEDVPITAGSIGAGFEHVSRISDHFGLGFFVEASHFHGYKFDGVPMDEIFGDGVTLSGYHVAVGPKIAAVYNLGANGAKISPYVRAAFVATGSKLKDDGETVESESIKGFATDAGFHIRHKQFVFGGLVGVGGIGNPDVETSAYGGLSIGFMLNN